MSNEKRRDQDEIPRKVMADMAKTAAAMQMRCGLVATSDKEGNVQWAAFIGELVERDKDPVIAYKKMLRRLAIVNEELAAGFSKQMDIARAKGAKEKPC